MKKILIVAMGLAAAGAAHATPVQWLTSDGGNGHYYDFVTFDAGYGDWTDARTAALSSTYLGLSGYLGTITSQAENDFIASLSSSVGYLGGSDLTTEGEWKWIDGPEAGQVFALGNLPLPGVYNNWKSGEPNNYGGTDDPYSGEDYLQINYGEAGKWNDIWVGGNSGGVPTVGYVVEYSSDTVSGAVPEPGVWALMIVGFGMMGSALRARRRLTA